MLATQSSAAPSSAATYSVLQFDPVLIRKLTRQGPRYTSYPTADRFSDTFGYRDYLQAVAGRADEGAVVAAVPAQPRDGHEDLAGVGDGPGAACPAQRLVTHGARRVRFHVTCPDEDPRIPSVVDIFPCGMEGRI